MHLAKASNQHGIGFVGLGAFGAAPAKSVDLGGIDEGDFVSSLMQCRSRYSIGPGAGGFQTGMDGIGSLLLQPP